MWKSNAINPSTSNSVPFHSLSVFPPHSNRSRMRDYQKYRSPRLSIGENGNNQSSPAVRADRKRKQCRLITVERIVRPIDKASSPLVESYSVLNCLQIHTNSEATKEREKLLFCCVFTVAPS